ncbi:MAG TPA: hypothetical protein VJ372_01615 [Pyrinomonadaceae bacterium]|jgi:hypothetical protein|nr:hypothetical protein [Pyrinomonadaceae bacterium]
MRFARIAFRFAGVYGLLVLVPMYLFEDKTGRDFPPPITHPEYYYGFVGLGVAWQVLFILLSVDPIRYRLMMIPSILEKVVFVVPVIMLFAQHRVSSFLLGAALIDLCLGVWFLLAYIKTAGVNGAT